MKFKRTILCFGLPLLLAFGFLVVSSSAQQEQGAQQQPQPPQSAPSKKTAKHERGPGQELVYETREAAGEEKDETAEFKQSPSIAFIARVTGLSVSHAYLFSVILNFLVVAVLILWLGYKFLPRIFRARTAAIQKAMQEAQKASEDARRRLAEIEIRLMKLDGEIGMMRDAAEKESASEEARIQAAAQQDARKIVEAAEQEISMAAKAARRELTAYAADLAVGLAQKQIRVDAAADQALLKEFALDLGSSRASDGKDRN